MRFTVLGPVEIHGPGQPYILRRAQVRAVLGLLLLNANRTVTPAELVTAIWGTTEPTSARNQIQSAVSTIRRHLRHLDTDTIIPSRPTGYTIRVNDDQLDLLAFHRAVARSRALLACGQPEDAATMLREGLTLWQGLPLGGAAGAYIEAARTDLGEQHLRAVEQLIDLDLGLGRHHEIVTDYLPLLRRHPFRERLRAALMIGLYRSGRQTDALAVYRELRTVLAEEHGIDPGTRLRRLQLMILRRDPALDQPHLVGSAEPMPGMHTRHYPSAITDEDRTSAGTRGTATIGLAARAGQRPARGTGGIAPVRRSVPSVPGALQPQPGCP